MKVKSPASLVVAGEHRLFTAGNVDVDGGAGNRGSGLIHYTAAQTARNLAEQTRCGNKTANKHRNTRERNML